MKRELGLFWILFFFFFFFSLKKKNAACANRKGGAPLFLPLCLLSMERLQSRSTGLFMEIVFDTILIFSFVSSFSLGMILSCLFLS